MPHPNGESYPARPQTAAAAQLIRLEPILGTSAARPLLLARLLDTCWAEEEPADPAEQ